MPFLNKQHRFLCLRYILYFFVEQRKTKNIVQNMLTIALDNKKSQVSQKILRVSMEKIVLNIE